MSWASLNIQRGNLAALSELLRSPQAAEAIAANVEAKRWQLSEIESGIKELDKGKGVDHADVKGWLQSWGEIRSVADIRSRCVRKWLYLRPASLADFLLVECKSEEESF